MWVEFISLLIEEQWEALYRERAVWRRQNVTGQPWATAGVRVACPKLDGTSPVVDFLDFLGFLDCLYYLDFLSVFDI